MSRHVCSILSWWLAAVSSVGKEVMQEWPFTSISQPLQSCTLPQFFKMATNNGDFLWTKTILYIELHFYFSNVPPLQFITCYKMNSLQKWAGKLTGLRSVQACTCMRLKVRYIHTHTHARTASTYGHANSVTWYPELICVSCAYVSCAFSSFLNVYGNVLLFWHDHCCLKMSSLAFFLSFSSLSWFSFPVAERSHIKEQCDLHMHTY